MLRILHTGPTAFSEHWIYELMAWARGDPDTHYTTFDPAALWLIYRLLSGAWSSSPPPSLSPRLSPHFLPDINNLVALLSTSGQTQDGEQIDRRVLVNLLLEKARECGMEWCGREREKAAVLFGVMHAASIHRRVRDMGVDEEVAGMMGGLGLGLGGEGERGEERDVVEGLAGEIEGVLRIEL
jgi:hypothetical protein